MKPLLLTSWDSALKTRDLRLVLVRQDSGKVSEWLPREFPYDSIIVEHLGGFVTFPALRWLATNGISLSVVDFNGAVVAAYLPDYPINSRDRLAQYEAFLSPHARLGVARFVLEAKLGREPPAALRTIPALLTFEAQAAERWWADLGVVREYPNATEPTNACINYAFGLLQSRAGLSVHRAGLEPSIGFLHTPQNYKSALVYDVMEPFRAETAKLALKVRDDLNSRDFGQVFGHGVRLRPEAAHRLVRAFARDFNDNAVDAFTSRLARRCAVLAPLPSVVVDRGSSRAGPQTEGRTDGLLTA